MKTGNHVLKLSILFFFLFQYVSSCSVMAQKVIYSNKNSKAIRLYKEAGKYVDLEPKKAMELLKGAIKKDSNFIEAHALLAELYAYSDQFEKAIEQYKKSISINPDFFPNNFYYIGKTELKLGHYADAKAHLERYLGSKSVDHRMDKDANLMLQCCDFALDALQHPVPFEPHNMGASINSPDYEYYPAITADDQVFLFTRNARTEAGGQTPEDFYVSRRQGSDWTPAVNVGSPINTPLSEGAPTLSADGQILIFAACDRPSGMGSCDIYFSRKVGNRWSPPMNIGPPINTKYWETQPSFSSDGKTLYFISNRPGGYGDADIWQSTLNENGTWGSPVNLGSKINTAGREESPYIHPDTKTLYFSSNGRVGMGGSDIYVSRKDEQGNWGEPTDLGYPINTFGNENSLLVSGSGNLAYFSSDRAGGYGGLDIYYFDLYEGARPGKITYMKGKVYDSRTKKPLAAAFELIDLQTSKVIIESESNQGNGEFLLCLPTDKNYALNVSKPGYLFYSENYSLKEVKDISKPFLMDVPLQPIDTGLTVELKNIFFETGKFDLKEESKTELQKLISFLNYNKTLKIEIGGHTDNTGDKKANILLSQNRAKSVYDYLLANGIPKERISYKGYGDTRPVAANDTAENKQKNRRTEFKVLAK
jgi:outer membrane protein OmpA-like peptidoglycan-associated protein/tetratricopeptide (TPR) repeat protein